MWNLNLKPSFLVDWDDIEEIRKVDVYLHVRTLKQNLVGPNGAQIWTNMCIQSPRPTYTSPNIGSCNDVSIARRIFGMMKTHTFTIEGGLRVLLAWLVEKTHHWGLTFTWETHIYTQKETWRKFGRLACVSCNKIHLEGPLEVGCCMLKPNFQLVMELSPCLGSYLV